MNLFIYKQYKCFFIQIFSSFGNVIFFSFWPGKVDGVSFSSMGQGFSLLT